MSMSDDTIAMRKGGKPAAGPAQPGQPAGGALPGLAAFGQMQSYTAGTQPAEQHPAEEMPAAAQPQDVAPQPEQAGVPQAAPYEQQAEQQAYEQPREPVHEQVYEQPPAETAAQLAEAIPEPAQPVQEPVQAVPEQMQPAHEPAPEYAGGFDAEAVPEALAAAYQEAGHQHQETPGADQAFSPEELQQYVSGWQEEGVDAQLQADAGAAPDHGDGMAEEQLEHAQQTALKTFEARYDQHPEIPLGSFDEQGEQAFYAQDGQQDAEFDAGMAPPEEMTPPKERKGKRMLMVACGLIGALALGGALAFAYKTGGNPQLADGGAPPLIKADDRPVKVTPKEPGGKQFPHQNKQIYDRLQGEQQPEVAKIVPRQEQVTPVASPASTALDSDTPMAAPQVVASADTKPQATPGAPHRVRTLQVRPDGSLVESAKTATATPQPAVPTLPAPTSRDIGGVAVTIPQTPAQPAATAQQADPTTVASITPAQQQPAPAAAPQPQAATPAPAPQVTAAVTPSPTPLPQPKPAVPAKPAPGAAAPANAAAPEGSIFVVQVASRRSQAMALAAYADLQQKYTRLLGNYQPMIQSADLGNKGTWYRLRLGPMSKKAEATSLCRSLKKAGLRSCLVRPL